MYDGELVYSHLLRPLLKKAVWLPTVAFFGRRLLRLRLGDGGRRKDQRWANLEFGIVMKTRMQMSGYTWLHSITPTRYPSFLARPGGTGGASEYNDSTPIRIS